VDGVLARVLVFTGDDVFQIVEIGVIFFGAGVRSAAGSRCITARSPAGRSCFVRRTSGCAFAAAPSAPATPRVPLAVFISRGRSLLGHVRIRQVEIRLLEVQVGLDGAVGFRFGPGTLHAPLATRRLGPLLATSAAPTAATPADPSLPVFLLTLAARQLDFGLLLGCHRRQIHIRLGAEVGVEVDVRRDVVHQLARTA
jgi:hypothetical protein